MQQLTNRLRRVFNKTGAMRSTLVLMGVLSLGGVAASVSTVSAHGNTLRFNYERGYSVQHNWLCYGWSNGVYHCTQHWHRAGGKLVSDHASWVPNVGGSQATTHAVAVTHAAPAKAVAPKAVAPKAVAPAPKAAPKAAAPKVSNATFAQSANPGTAAIQNEIRAVFGPYANQALNVARCESGFNPNAYNPTPVAGAHAMGVFQILGTSTWLGTSYASQSPYNASANIHAAYQIFSRDGFSWREWACKP